MSLDSTSPRLAISLLVHLLFIFNQCSNTQADGYFHHWYKPKEFTTDTQDADYCSITSCSNTSKHTMCLYPTSTPASNCVDYVDGTFSSEEKSTIVNWHNEMRKKVADGEECQGSPGCQPPASNMKEMKWDDELASIAERWADQCASGHDECRNVERFVVGQNIASLWSTYQIDASDIVKPMQAWYNEVCLFNNNDVSNYQFDFATSHYTQLVWADTNLVGCARVIFFDESANMNSLELVCNYGPAGNYYNQPIYQIGEAASNCPSGVSETIPSLCN